MVLLREMIGHVRRTRRLSQKDLAKALCITPQYLCDIEHGRRLGSVEVVERLCVMLRLTEQQRRKWHQAGARSHGWEV